MQWDSVEKWISAAIMSNLNIGGLYVSAAKEKRSQALTLWLNESLPIVRVKVEADFDNTMFTTTNMTEMVYESYIHYLDNNTNSDVRNPEKSSKTNGIFGRKQ